MGPCILFLFKIAFFTARIALADAWLGFVLAMFALVLLLCFTKPRFTERNLSAGCLTRFTFYFDALARKFGGISTYRVVSSLPIVLVCTCGHYRTHSEPLKLTCILLRICRFHTTFFPFPLLLSSVPGYIPKDSHLSASGPRYYLETLFLHSAFLTYPPLCSVLPDPACLICLLQSWDKMAVVFLFTFASLTDGRSARDVPKQRREKKIGGTTIKRKHPICCGSNRVAKISP